MPAEYIAEMDASISNSVSTPLAVEAGTPITIDYQPMADGAEGTFQALAAMAACVRGEVGPDFCGYQHEPLRQLAERIVRDVPSHDSTGEIAALLLFVRDQVAYRLHPWNQQRVQDAARTLQLGSGDCVSKSVLLATLLLALGYPARFVAQSEDGREYSHVYVEAFDKGTWVALDPVYPKAEPGWSQALPDGGFETTWPIFDEE